MNNINNIFKQNEIENKLKDFKEGKDYSVLWENDKKTYNFHSDMLREILGRNNYTTVYEAAENWDSDNFNYHREAGEYVSNNVGESGNRGRITYRYEHRINKNGDYHIE
jgi:adenylyl- and sulfurtransferase ThiI